MISISAKPTTTDHIGYVVKITLITDWYDSIFSNDEKMSKFTKFSAPFYIIHYHQMKKYLYLGYLLGSKQLIFTINIIYIT